MLIFTIIIKSGNRIINVAITVTEMTVVIIIRLLALRSFIPEGTGGTEISETFSVSGFLASLRSEILYLFGVNTGPEHLNGINFADVNIIIKCCIATAFIFLVLFVIKFIIAAIMYSEKFEIKWTANILLFLGFIIGSIVASSVTIRVEMRWLYAPYLFLLLFFHLNIVPLRPKNM